MARLVTPPTNHPPWYLIAEKCAQNFLRWASTLAAEFHCVGSTASFVLGCHKIPS